MSRIAIFASGSGSNAENIFNYFEGNSKVEVSLIIANKPEAYVLERAERLGVPSVVFSGKEFRESEVVLETLREHQIDFVVLAGFLLLVPEYLIKAYPEKIVNIHPALLPKYGGKGMYGDNVHKAVVANQDLESGITIHYVNEKYDEGNIIRQEKVALSISDTYEDVASKIHQLEYKYFPMVIDEVVSL